jgi:hypothetical protein
VDGQYKPTGSRHRKSVDLPGFTFKGRARRETESGVVSIAVEDGNCNGGNCSRGTATALTQRTQGNDREDAEDC